MPKELTGVICDLHFAQISNHFNELLISIKMCGIMYPYFSQSDRSYKSIFFKRFVFLLHQRFKIKVQNAILLPSNVYGFYSKLMDRSKNSIRNCLIGRIIPIKFYMVSDSQLGLADERNDRQIHAYHTYAYT